MASQPPQGLLPEKGIVLTFVGPILPPASIRLRNACSAAVNEKVTKLKILFASNGGSLDEGFALYGFLRALPVELTIHAIGSVESIASVVFLAPDRRLATAQSHFMFHAFNWPFQAQTYDLGQIADIHELLTNSKKKYSTIFEERTSLTAQELDQLNAPDKVHLLDAQLARQKGIVQKIEDATVPAGWSTYNIEY